MYRITLENVITEKIKPYVIVFVLPPFHWSLLLRVHLEVYGNSNSSVSKLDKPNKCSLLTSHVCLHFDVVPAKVSYGPVIQSC